MALDPTIPSQMASQFEIPNLPVSPSPVDPVQGLPEPPRLLREEHLKDILETWQFVQEMFRDIHAEDYSKGGRVAIEQPSNAAKKTRRRLAPYILLGLQFIGQQCLKRAKDSSLCDEVRSEWFQAANPAMERFTQFLDLDVCKQLTSQYVEHGKDVSIALLAFGQAKVTKQMMEERHGFTVGSPNPDGWRECEKVWQLLLRYITSEPRGIDRLKGMMPQEAVISRLRDVERHVRYNETFPIS